MQPVPAALAVEEAATTMPLAIAHDIVDGGVSLFDDALPPARSDLHLARLKQGLLLYVKAKYVDKVKFTWTCRGARRGPRTWGRGGVRAVPLA